jgi:hypothetical protein
MTWHLQRVPASVELATADAPVVSIVRDGQSRVLFSGGLSFPGVEVSFPINPSTCIFLHRHGPDFEVPPSETFTRAMNTRMVRNAERFVISRQRAPQIENAVKRFSYTRQSPKLNKAEVLKLFQLIGNKL